MCLKLYVILTLISFLISSFRRVQNVVCFLLGFSPASDLYIYLISLPALLNIHKTENVVQGLELNKRNILYYMLFLYI